VGGAIDYSRASTARAMLQDALDATALALSREPTVDTMTSTQRKTFATNYFNANFQSADLTSVTLTPTYDSTGPSVTVAGTGSMPTDFLGIVGVKNFPLSASSTTIWGESRLRVALVLDNTGSMADAGKMDALKTATKNLITQLKNAASVNGDVYVSMIPFSKDVNVGTSNYTKTWIRWDDGTDNSWDGSNGSCSKFGYSPRSSCQAQGTCSSWFYSSKSSCQSAGKTWTQATWTPDAHSTWSGCVEDRDQDYDTKNTAPSTGTTGTLFPAEESSNCPPGVVMGLTYDWTALSNAVDAMSPNGTTNQAIGLQWGWQSLTQSPFTIPAFDSKYTYKTIIVLLTDGLNTQDRWYGNGSTVSTQVDAREQILCNNIETANIEVYAVQVNTGGDPTSTLLQNCATDSSHFFLLTSASQIVTTFNAIGTALSDLRLKS
jgi:Flp pilus assembly protein TadG